MALNQYSNGEAFWRGGEERIWHDVNAGGDCRVPWCTYMTDVEGSEHLNLDRVLQESGQFNPFKKLRTLDHMEQRIREVLFHEFSDEVHENADFDRTTTLELALMVLRLLKKKLKRSNDKLQEFGKQRNQWCEQLSTLNSYMWDTFPMRARALERAGATGTVQLFVALVEQLRNDLLSATTGLSEWMTDKNEPAVDPDAVTVASVYPKGDTMQPHARRERTLNELHTLLHNMLLSGVDVAVRDLQDYLARHATAVHALVRTSMQLEGFSEECCIGCEEHGPKNVDPKYDRPDVKRCHYCIEYGRDRCTKHSS